MGRGTERVSEVRGAVVPPPVEHQQQHERSDRARVNHNPNSTILRHSRRDRHTTTTSHAPSTGRKRAAGTRNSKPAPTHTPRTRRSDHAPRHDTRIAKYTALMRQTAVPGSVKSVSTCGKA